MFECEEEYTAHCNAEAEAEAQYCAEQAETEAQQDEHIIECARELVKAINDSGRNMKFEKDGELIFPVTFDVCVYNHYTPERLSVHNITNDWEVYGDYKE